MAVDTVVTSDDLARFKRTELIARSVVEGFVSGLHKSPFKGFALDFSHYREYTRGDEVKHLDWSLYARTDKYYVKQYDEFTVLKSHILLDTSGSMNYTSGTVTKFDYARFIARARKGSGGYFSLGGGVCFGGGGVEGAGAPMTDLLSHARGTDGCGSRVRGGWGLRGT